MAFAYLVEEAFEVFACLVEVVFAYLVEENVPVPLLDSASVFLRRQNFCGPARRLKNALFPLCL